MTKIKTKKEPVNPENTKIVEILFVLSSLLDSRFREKVNLQEHVGNILHACKMLDDRQLEKLNCKWSPFVFWLLRPE